MVLPDLSLERGEGNGKSLRGLGEVAFQLREGIVNDLFFAFIKGLEVIPVERGTSMRPSATPAFPVQETASITDPCRVNTARSRMYFSSRTSISSLFSFFHTFSLQETSLVM